MDDSGLENATEFVRVAAVNEIPPGSYVKRSVAGRSVLICRVGHEVYAIEDRCSHAGLPLDGGVLKGRCIVCPMHGAEFDVSTGKELSPPAIRPIRCYSVRVVDAYVEVSHHPIPAKNPTQTFRLGM